MAYGFPGSDPLPGIGLSWNLKTRAVGIRFAFAEKRFFISVAEHRYDFISHLFCIKNQNY
jgi:hypothetical protein